MKKFLLLTVAFLFVILPFISFTQTPISDSELSEVTAEEGVSIDFSQLNVGGISSLGVTSYGDGDGYNIGTYTSTGFGGLANVYVAGNIATFSGSGNIDVGSSGTQTRVTITPPTITLGEMDADTIMKLGTTMNLSAGKSLGRAHIEGFSTQLTADCVQVYAH
ncbi:MAG: hypothetical protein JW976_01310 [Syntrophaceae bacterium]|nr:hypothetical protein [Syntrophaceae bacterium]